MGAARPAFSISWQDNGCPSPSRFSRRVGVDDISLVIIDSCAPHCCARACGAWNEFISTLSARLKPGPDTNVKPNQARYQPGASRSTLYQRQTGSCESSELIESAHLIYSYRSMRALYIAVVVMAVFVACQGQDDNRIYAMGSKGVTPPKVISTVQPTVSDPKQQKSPTEQRPGAGDHNSAPNNTEQKSPQAAPGVKSGKAESGEAEPGKDDPAKDESAKEKSGKPGNKKKPTYTGIAIISGYVGKDGKFHDAKVTRSAGKDLDPRALQKLSEWRFDPCKRNGVPVNCGMTIEVTFNLY
jgi:TonB family protein